MEKNKLKLNLQFFSEEETDKNNNDNNGSKDEQDKQEEVTFTPEQQKKVDEIIERRLAKENRNTDKKVHDAVEEAKRYAKMTKDQKTECENEKLQQELAELRKEKALNEMKNTARVAFNDSGIVATDELLDLVVTAEAETTKANVESYTELRIKLTKLGIKGSVPGLLTNIGYIEVSYSLSVDQKFKK
ncbi:DUF4355 domain-containing protein [Mammaliicoccus vitulinus]|uniref:DUF4355 domain-containing protein n=1 Tax=Mammaliicoccus vitulinus TaxID=71237 RepID=UPI000E6A37D3|nr:DUF4355 domain-containing protein [Mammaliicoccus vitulinus]RIN14592.1 DUF4355 domain-containing protein [Mammaliicoccus vitulinus]